MAKITFIEAAYKILKRRGASLTAPEITKIAVNEGIIATKGKTPELTMNSVLNSDINNRGNKSLFIKVFRGKFGLKEWEKSQKNKNIKKGSFKEAAFQVLKLENKPLSIQKITEIAKKKNLFKSTGKTPWATMGAQLYMDIKKFGNKSSFVKLSKNKFGLREWNISAIKNEIDNKNSCVVGEPINFEGLIYGPLNEQGVIFLFSKIHDKLGIKD